MKLSPVISISLLRSIFILFLYSYRSWRFLCELILMWTSNYRATRQLLNAPLLRYRQRHCVLYIEIDASFYSYDLKCITTLFFSSFIHSFYYCILSLFDLCFVLNIGRDFYQILFNWLRFINITSIMILEFWPFITILISNRNINLILLKFRIIS